MFLGELDSTSDRNGRSRLLSSTAEVRDSLLSRNLYTPDNEYKENNTGIVNALSGVLDTLAPFKSINLKDSLVGRIANPSPLTEIGTVMLGQQFAYNASSNASQSVAKFNIGSLFDKNTSNFFGNFNITDVDRGTGLNGFLGNAGDILNSIVGAYPSRMNPFNPNSTNIDYIKNTSKGQLGFLNNAFNQNLYRPENKTLEALAKTSNLKLLNPTTIIRTFFNFSNSEFYPYYELNPTSLAEVNAEAKMRTSFETVFNEFGTQQYAPNLIFVDAYFGNTTKERKRKFYFINDGWIDENVPFDENPDNQIIWGRDGVSEYVNNIEDRGDGVSTVRNQTNLPNDYNVRLGLLEYTRNLLNSTAGQIIDQTKKIFQDGENLHGFNGAGLWTTPDNAISVKTGLNTSINGIRQHTYLDPYDKFAKAIRFDGNAVYGGNINSVINKTVLPQIHPFIETNAEGVSSINTKDLMFSIENLAINVNGDGFIDDGHKTQLPLCEVGSFGGRIMWFPPYDISINETSTAKYESTVMIGRNEPMYNYINSERSGTLSFTLLVDYPEQLKYYEGNNKNKAIAQFFAFGDTDTHADYNSSDIEEKIKRLQAQIDGFTNGTLEVEQPTITPPSGFAAYFPNAMPNESQINTVFDTMYNTHKYEIPDCKPSSGYSNNDGLNVDIYYIDELEPNPEKSRYSYILPDGANISQYTLKETSKSTLNQKLSDLFSKPNAGDLIDIKIVGSASSPDTVENNKALGERRANAVKKLIIERLKVIFADDLSGVQRIIDDNNAFKIESIGETQATSGSDINSTSTKKERSATVEFIANGRTIPPKKAEIDAVTDAQIKQLQKEIENLKTKKRASDSGCNMFNNRDKSTGMLKGFQAISGNYFYPAFHSQTPEDFHKRLKFLQQCTRQGSSIRYNPEIDANGIPRAKNSVFGRQPICIIRMGDFIYSKVIIESINFDYSDSPWDLNPEGFGMQFMLAKITMNLKMIGGQSLKGPIDALQNAVSFNYYANSNFSNKGVHARATEVAENQNSYNQGIKTTKKSD